MMNHANKSALAAAIVAGFITAASAYTFKEFKAAPAAIIQLPATPDSVSSENPFKKESLLESRLHDPYAALGWTTMQAGPDGTLHLVEPQEKHELHTFSTRLRAERYAEGNLVLHTRSLASVKVNGETKITHEAGSAEESKAKLKLNPQADYDIVIDILAEPSDSIQPDFKLEFIADKKFEGVNLKSAGSMKGRVSQATAIDGERVTAVSLSADGKYLITSTAEAVSNSETLRRAVLSETASGKIISYQLDEGSKWIPGESAYTTVRERKGKYDVYRTEVPSMQTSLLTKGVEESEFTITPGGRYMLYYREVKPDAEKGPMRRITRPDDRIPGDNDRNYLMRRDLQTGVSVPVTAGGPSTMLMDVSRDGKKLIYASVRQTPDHFPFYSTTLVEIDIESLKCDTLIRNFEQTLTDAVYSPDARQLFIISGPDSFGGIGANYGDHEIGNDFDGQGFIYDIATRQARAMTRDFDPAISQATWNAADGCVYFLGETGFFQYIYKLEPKTGKITELKTEVPYIRSYSVASSNKEWLAYRGGSFTADGEAYVLNRLNGKSRLVTAPLRELTDLLEFGEMQPWNFTSAGGDEIEGWLCLPPEFDSNKKYPLIVYYYGGTSPSNATFYHNYSPQVLASRDYVVYVINPSGTTGYGQEFSARHVNAWGKQTAEEIIEGTKKFCDAHPYVDEKKIGCIGASYGGFMTQYLLTRTDIFAAAVSHAGISNVTSYWGEGFWGYSYNAVAAAKRYPWSDPDLFTRQGSLFNADKIHTPLLLLHGSQDTNVPIGESIQLFNALKILGRDVEFITVEGENHVIRGYDNRLIWQNTIMAWFAKYLQDDSGWWDSLY